MVDEHAIAVILYCLLRDTVCYTFTSRLCCCYYAGFIRFTFVSIFRFTVLFDGLIAHVYAICLFDAA